MQSGNMLDKQKYQLLFWGAFGFGIALGIALAIAFWKDFQMPRDLYLIGAIFLATIGTGTCWGVGMILFSKAYYKIRDKLHKQADKEKA